MRRGKVAVLVGLIALFAGWWLGIFDENKSDEDRIRDAIKQVASGAEQAKIDIAIEPFSPAYSDPEGLDRRGIYGMMWSQFKKRGPISVWMSAIDVSVENEAAVARFDAALLEGSESGGISLPISADVLTFEVNLEKESSEWLIVSHTRTAAWILPDHAP